MSLHDDIAWWKAQSEIQRHPEMQFLAWGIATGLKLAQEDYGARDPCGECHLQPGERCDICGLKAKQ